MFERVVLAIGTRKGLFVAEASKRRRKFELRGPFGKGVGVYSVLIDARRKPRIEIEAALVEHRKDIFAGSPADRNVPRAQEPRRAIDP